MLVDLQYEYLWADGIKVKRPIRVCAHDYVGRLFEWVEDQVMFPKPMSKFRFLRFGCQPV